MKLPQDSILNLTCAPPPRLTSEEAELKVCGGQRGEEAGRAPRTAAARGGRAALRGAGWPGTLCPRLLARKVDVLLPQLDDNVKGKKFPLRKQSKSGSSCALLLFRSMDGAVLLLALQCPWGSGLCRHHGHESHPAYLLGAEPCLGMLCKDRSLCAGSQMLLHLPEGWESQP